MLSDSCFLIHGGLWLNRILLSSFHGMISSYHAVFGLRHRDKSAKVIGLSGQTRGKRFHYRRLFTANVYDGGCKRLREKAHSFGESDPVWPISVPRASYSSRERPGKRLRSCPTWSGNLSCEQWLADKRGRRQGPRLSSCDIPDWDDRHPLTDNLLPRTRPLQNRDSFHWAVWER